MVEFLRRLSALVKRELLVVLKDPSSRFILFAPAVVYSLLRAAQHDSALRDKLQRELKLELEGSNAFWRRATQAQSLWCLALFIRAGLTQGQSLQDMMAPLLRAVCPTT